MCTVHGTTVEVHASTLSLHIDLVYHLGSKLCIFSSEQNEQINSWKIPSTCCQNLQLHFWHYLLNISSSLTHTHWQMAGIITVLLLFLLFVVGPDLATLTEVTRIYVFCSHLNWKPISSLKLLVMWGHCALRNGKDVCMCSLSLAGKVVVFSNKMVQAGSDHFWEQILSERKQDLFTPTEAVDY